MPKIKQIKGRKKCFIPFLPPKENVDHKRAALEQKITFADTIKEQEKTLAKLKLQQELSETLAEEAVYRVALNAGDENNEDESLSQVAPKGFGSIIDSFLYEQKPSGSVSPHVTNSSASATQTSSSVKQSSLLEKQPQVSSSIQSPTRVTQSSGSQTSTGQGSQTTALAT